MDSTRSNLKFKHVFSHPSRWEKLKLILQKAFDKKDSKQYVIYNQLVKNLAVLFKHDKNYTYTDHEVFTYIHEYLNENYYPIHGYPNNESHNRSMSRVIDIQDIYRQIKGKKIPVSYLDIGCSRGTITSLLTNSMKIHSAYAIDIIESTNLQGIEYTQVSENESALPYSDSKFDLITCLMSLHHIKNLESYVNEIYRCLNPNGIIIIQEHDAQDFDDYIFLDILHGLYSMSWCKMGEQEDPLFCKNYSAQYYSKKHLNMLFKKVGFTRIEIEPKKYESIPWNNLFNNYWAVYRK